VRVFELSRRKLGLRSCIYFENCNNNNNNNNNNGGATRWQCELFLLMLLSRSALSAAKTWFFKKLSP
jgi:hypothetical protein